MAIGFCRCNIISRNKGNSCVAAAAYRAAEKLQDDYYGVIHDYTKKQWVVHKEIILPEGVLSEVYGDRSVLWSEVERMEKGSDSQLGREILLAIPKELPMEHQIEVVRDFIQENFTKYGIIVDCSFHNPPVMDDLHRPLDVFGNPTSDINKMIFRNPHCHALSTMRPIENGKWVQKSCIEYICKRESEEKKFTAEEFAIAKLEGWQKQYCFRENGKRIWLTKQEGEERGLERLNRSPKTTPYGRVNPMVEYLNSHEREKDLKRSWEEICNQKFISLGMEERMHWYSNKEGHMPTKHLGPAVTAIERKIARLGKQGIVVPLTEIGYVNNLIKEHNQIVNEYCKKISKLPFEYMEKLQWQLVGAIHQKKSIKEKFDVMKKEMEFRKTLVERLGPDIDSVKNENILSEQKIEELKKEIASCSMVQMTKKASLQKKLEDEKEEIKIRIQYLDNLLQRCGITDLVQYEKIRYEYEQKKEEYNNLKSYVEMLEKKIQCIINMYRKHWEEFNEKGQKGLQYRYNEFEYDLQYLASSGIELFTIGDYKSKELMESMKLAGEMLMACANTIVKSSKKKKKRNK